MEKISTLKEQIIELLKIEDGLTDREITDRIKGRGEPQQSVNITCRNMESKGIIKRIRGQDGLIRNYLGDFKKGYFYACLILSSTTGNLKF
ncbi:hypothetical protein [Anoxybacillus kestanbolensis]|uniref:hypothetical protein n=1 Tax=Anoxybacillus kestanbolensis TaxID=227476 RepID=UPI003D208C52